MPALKIYSLDRIGVIVDTDPVDSPDGQLTKSQNAIPEPLGSLGSLRKRPGLKRFNAVVADGEVKGGAGIPFFLGSAGPDFENPFIDLPFTIADYTAPEFTTDPALGATFDDESFFFEYDWTLDGGALEDFEFLPEGENDPSLDDTEDPTDDEATGSSLIALVIVGAGTDWYVGLNESLSESADNSGTYPNPKSLLFPTTSLRGEEPLSDWFTGGASSDLLGRPMVTLNGALYYAEDGA